MFHRVLTVEDIFIGGDFNARTSNKQETAQDLNPYLCPKRVSMDKEDFYKRELIARPLGLK